MKSHSLAVALCCLGGLFVTPAAVAQQLYSNGPFITTPGAHVPSGDVSLAQDVTYEGFTALGYNAGPDFRLTDDFTVPADHIWTIDSAVLFGYQTDSADAPFTDARVIIWRGFPDFATSTKLFDGSVSNNLVTSTPGAWRTAESFGATTYSNGQRRIKELLLAITPLELTEGTYWLDWQLKGADPTKSVYTPPVTILGQPYTASGGLPAMKCPAGITDPENACTNVAGFWILFSNGTAPYINDLPFELNGTDLVNTIFKDGFDPDEEEL